MTSNSRIVKLTSTAVANVTFISTHQTYYEHINIVPTGHARAIFDQ